MASRRPLLRYASLFAVGSLWTAAGCNHPAYPPPYGTGGSPYSTWAAPGTTGATPSTTLPPPVGYQGPAATMGPQVMPQGAATSTPATGWPATAAPPATAVPGAAATTTVPGAGLQGPNWNDPGTLSQQQQRANVFDPFANNEVAPEIVGGRPRDFQKPMSEATRAHGFRDPRIPF